MATRPSIDTEYVNVLLDEAGGQDLDGTVELAFVADGTEPGDDDWHTAAWEDDVVSSTRVARVLVGPDQDVALDDGDYIVWYRLTDSPEIIARPAGRLTIT